jgi:hypothetical protein
MSLSKKLSSYAHIQSALDALLENGGEGNITFSTKKAAYRWRAEAYMFRRLYKESLQNRLAPSQAELERYSDLFLVIEDCTVSVSKREWIGRILDKEGQEIIPAPPPKSQEDDLLLEAAVKLIREKGDG